MFSAVNEVDFSALESLEAINHRLRDMGVEARFVHFPDENHWVLKPRNSVVWYREFHGWLERFLGDPRSDT